MHEPFFFTHYPNESILVVTLDKSFSVANDLGSLMEQAKHTLNTVPHVFYVIDVRGVRASFEDLVVGSSKSARGAGTVLHHPNIREIVVVTDDKLIALGVQGLKSPVFGLGAVSVFETLDGALAYCREKIAMRET